MKDKYLLIVTAVIEGATGLALLAWPSRSVGVLLDAPLWTPATEAVGRIAGAALVALGIACWLARGDDHTRAAKGIFAGMLFYNVAAVGVLGSASVVSALTGAGLWPGVILHSVLAVWCFLCLWFRKRG
jgi:hypothetical protein